MRYLELSNAHSIIVIRHMGNLNSTENSLNQHIRLKHKEFWETIRRKCAQLVARGQYNDDEDQNEQNSSIEDKSDDYKSVQDQKKIPVDIGIIDEDERQKQEDL